MRLPMHPLPARRAAGGGGETILRLPSYTVMRLRGNSKFEFAIAAPTRSLLSFTAPPGAARRWERREAVGDVGLDVYEIGVNSQHRSRVDAGEHGGR